MFKITPIQDFKTQEDLALKCGTYAKQGYFSYAMIDIDTQDLMAISQFDVRGEYGYISDIKSVDGLEDFEAMFILGRSTMNFIDLCGAHKCYAELNSADKKLLSAIGFKTIEDDKYVCDMTGMFDGHCSGEAVKLN